MSGESPFSICACEPSSSGSHAHGEAVILLDCENCDSSSGEVGAGCGGCMGKLGDAVADCIGRLDFFAGETRDSGDTDTSDRFRLDGVAVVGVLIVLSPMNAKSLSAANLLVTGSKNSDCFFPILLGGACVDGDTSSSDCGEVGFLRLSRLIVGGVFIDTCSRLGRFGRWAGALFLAFSEVTANDALGCGWSPVDVPVFGTFETWHISFNAFNVASFNFLPKFFWAQPVAIWRALSKSVGARGLLVTRFRKCSDLSL